MAAMLLGGLILTTPATAQVALGATLSSQASARGVALAGAHPAVQASLDWDGVGAADGGRSYASLHAAPGLAFAGRSSITELDAYGGVAALTAAGASLDAGVIRRQFQGAAAYSYDELYAGLAFDRIGARLSWSPAYYGEGGHTLYAESNAFHPLGENLKLLAHLGWLHGVAGAAARQRERLDLRLALSYDSGDCNLQLAWLARTSFGAGSADNLPRPRALSLSASIAF